MLNEAFIAIKSQWRFLRLSIGNIGRSVLMMLSCSLAEWRKVHLMAILLSRKGMLLPKGAGDGRVKGIFDIEGGIFR